MTGYITPTHIRLWLMLALAFSAFSTSLADEANLRQNLSYLASDQLEGRGIGTKGLDQAAEFLATQFEEMGLKTDWVDGKPYQNFEVNVASKLGPKSKNHVLLQGEGLPQPKKLKLGEDFRPLAIGGSATFDAPLVFVGYGISAPKLDYDDYDGIDVEGKFVVMLRKEPQQNNPHGKFDGSRPTRHALFSRKVSNAFQHGAAGVIFVNDEFGLNEKISQVESAWQTAVADISKLHADWKPDEKTDKQVAQYQKEINALAKKIAEYGDQIEQGMDEVLPLEGAGSESGHPKLPVIFAKRSVFDSIVRQHLGKDLSEIEASIDQDLKPVVGELKGVTIAGEVAVQRETAMVRNVIGLIEAPNATSDQVIVIGAHYDHLGFGGPGSLAPLTKEIHNGADDNASGTTALLAVANRLVENRDQLRHRVVVVAFTGEERGLLGSSHYVKQPVVPIDKTEFMLNMDMVGRLKDNKLIVMGTGTAEILDAIVDDANSDFQFELSKDPGGFGPSDHASFYARKVPVLAVFTGTHDDYHRPSDDFDKINYQGMQRIIDYATALVLAVDQSDERPRYLAVESSQPQMRTGSRPYFGSIPDFTVVGKGYGIQGVSPGSPADEAGIQGGDIMIDLGGNKIGGLEDFDSALRKFKAGEKVEATMLRDGKKVNVVVTLAPPK